MALFLHVTIHPCWRRRIFIMRKQARKTFYMIEFCGSSNLTVIYMFDAHILSPDWKVRLSDIVLCSLRLFEIHWKGLSSEQLSSLAPPPLLGNSLNIQNTMLCTHKKKPFAQKTLLRSRLKRWFDRRKARRGFFGQSRSRDRAEEKIESGENQQRRHTPPRLI